MHNLNQEQHVHAKTIEILTSEYMYAEYTNFRIVIWSDSLVRIILRLNYDIMTENRIFRHDVEDSLICFHMIITFPCDLYKQMAAAYRCLSSTK